MKVTKIQQYNSQTPVKVTDCFVDKGYLQGEAGSLCDVDLDFQSDRRQEVKEYLEKRYNHGGKQRVLSAGTFTTLKIKAAIKDVCRVHRVPPSIVNYITAIFDDDKCDWTGAFKLAYQNPKVKKFITDHSDVFEEIRTLMYQPRSSSIHASALIVTPDTRDGEEMECFDFMPIKRVDDVLVSEIDGYSIDEIGLLKNDILGIKELSKLKATMAICNKEYNASVSLESIVTGEMNDEKAYKLFTDGYTQNIFQFSSKGMTKFVMNLKPTCIQDLIAANALFRPATLANGSAQKYIDCKVADVAPTYLWGTYNALKETYGLLAFQEDLAQIAREVGGFSLGEGVKLVKFISKKKVDKIKSLKDKFLKGAESKWCPKDDAIAIWDMIESGGSYLFNKSHATAYAATAYAGAFLKANYPLAFYTVAFQWCNDDEIFSLMSEMQECSNATVVYPDINISGATFFTDYKSNEIFWSLSKIKQVGTKAVEWIVNEREKNGEFTSIDNFLDRVYKYKLKKYEYWDDPENEDEVQRCPVNARHILNLILSGCFDKIENVKALIERFQIVKKAADRLGFVIKEQDFPEDLIDKHYYWSQKQLQVSGIGSIDYERIFRSSPIRKKMSAKARYCPLKKALDRAMDGEMGGFCATVVEVTEKKYRAKKDNKDKVFCKMKIQQNNEICDVTIWDSEYASRRGTIINSKDKMVIFSAKIKFSDFSQKNEIVFYNNSIIEIL